MILTKNFKLEEFERSFIAERFGILNKVPDFNTLSNIHLLCVKLLQPLRNKYGKCLITSGYRCVELNQKIMGAPSSSHSYGFAADVYFVDADMIKVFSYIIEKMIFDECLLFKVGGKVSYMHLSFNPRLRLIHRVVEK